MAVQGGVLAPVPAMGRYLTFKLKTRARPRSALLKLAAMANGSDCVVGLGQATIHACGAKITGMRAFPRLSAKGIPVPSTPAALWCWLRGNDRGELVHQTRRLVKALGAAYSLLTVVDAFRHDGGRDLTGYEDGTENPKGKKALAAAIAQGRGAGIDGSSYVAVQQWVHDFAKFDAMSAHAQDNAMGRRRRDNVELENAPRSAHVKRTAQENFSPEAFLLRRSMPWTDARSAGLMFVAFGKSFDAFEAQMRRMAGADDRITDALFKFTLPVSGAYFWCPPVRNGKLDFRALLKG